MYQASVLHSVSPPSALNGRGERTCTTRLDFRPSIARVTFLPSADTVAELTFSVSSSIFGPP